MACYAPSADGRYYPNYAQGNAPVASNVIVGNAYAAVSAAGALATGAFRDHRRIERRGHQTPFRRRVGVRQAAAEGAAHADRVMGNVACDEGE